MTGGIGNAMVGPGAAPREADSDDRTAAQELDDIKRQLADLQSKLSRCKTPTPLSLRACAVLCLCVPLVGRLRVPVRNLRRRGWPGSAG